MADARLVINVVDNLESESAIDALSANQGRVLKEMVDDITASNTEWVDIPLSGNVVAYASNAVPKCRSINGVVYLKGAVKGIVADNTIIGVLPAGYRPAVIHNYMQLTSTQGTATGVASANFSRIKVATNGQITMEAISTALTATYDSEHWFPINTSFPVD